MWGWGAAVAIVLDIVNKFVPQRRQRIRDKIASLEKQLEEALVKNDATKAAEIMKQLKELRKKVSDEK